MCSSSQMASCWWHCRRDRTCQAERQRCARAWAEPLRLPRHCPYLCALDDLLPAVLQSQPSLVPILLPGVAVKAELGRQLGQPKGAVGVQPVHQLLQLLGLLAKSRAQSWVGATGNVPQTTSPCLWNEGLEPQRDPSQVPSIATGSPHTPPHACIPPTRPKEPVLVPEPKKPLKRLAARFFQVSVPLVGRELMLCRAGSGLGMLLSPRNSVMFFLRRPGACNEDSQCPQGQRQRCGQDGDSGLADLEHRGTDGHPGQWGPPAKLPCPH